MLLSITTDDSLSTGLRELDLSCGRLSGRIPSSLGNCKKLSVVNLSHNNLEGGPLRCKTAPFNRDRESPVWRILYLSRRQEHDPMSYGDDRSCGEGHGLRCHEQRVTCGNMKIMT